MLEAPAGKEEDLYEDVEQEEDGADDVQVEHGLVLLVLPQTETLIIISWLSYYLKVPKWEFRPLFYEVDRLLRDWKKLFVLNTEADIRHFIFLHRLSGR